MDDDDAFLERLRAGDEGAFRALVERHDGALRRLARTFVHTPSAADDVVQETWLGVIHGLSAFEGRSSLRTWIFRILVNAAQAHAKRERRNVPLQTDAVVDLDHARNRRSAMPLDEQVVLKETVAHVHAAIGRLSAPQRDVITLRDVHGWTPEDVSGRLGISRGHQRVLLHRAREQVRNSLSGYLNTNTEAA
jgi:RNA polymerase sigma-70 factor (ECF subfamily)